MSRNTIDAFITVAMIFSMCVMWFIIGYNAGKIQGEKNERQAIVSIKVQKVNNKKWEK